MVDINISQQKLTIPAEAAKKKAAFMDADLRNSTMPGMINYMGKNRESNRKGAIRCVHS